MGLLPARGDAHGRRSCRCSGEDLLTASAERVNALRGNRMAMIFQEPMTALNPAYTIGNQLMEVLSAPPRRRARRRRASAPSTCSARSASRRRPSGSEQYPHQLSGGLRQRVMIAMALMCGPELLIADEPTTALDVTIQAQILRLLADLQRTSASRIVLITHDLGVVARIAHRVAVMYAGEIVEEGDGRRACSRRRAIPTRAGCSPASRCPGARERGDRLGTIPGVVPSLIGEIRGCSFRDRCAHARPECAGAVPLRSAGASIAGGASTRSCRREHGCGRRIDAADARRAR